MAKSKKKAVKKPAKRKPAKKKIAKRNVAKRNVARRKPARAKRKVYLKVSSKILGEAPQEFEFYLSDGRKLRSIYELVDALETMEEEIFNEHVNEMKNDFSNWVNDVFKEPKIAKEIQKTRNRVQTQRVLIKKLIEAAKKAHTSR